MEPISTILVSLVSIILGFLISTWRNRLLPWIAILEFAESQRNDTVKIDKALHTASRQSWVTNALGPDEDNLLSISNCLAYAKGWIRDNTNTEAKINESIKQISTAKSDDDVILALDELLEHAGISTLVEEAMRRGKVSPSFTESSEEKIRYYVHEKLEEGCFVLVFQDGYVSFGRNFNEFPHRRDLLLPFVKTISRLDRQSIIEILEKLIPLCKEQREVNKLLVDECQKISDNNMRWRCEFMITNFGATPFILFPGARLCIAGKHIKPFSINSQLLYRTSDDEKNDSWSPTKSFKVIQPGETQKLAVVTDIQQNIEGSGVLKGVFKSGECNGYLKLQITGREITWKSWFKSAQLPFQEIKE